MELVDGNDDDFQVKMILHQLVLDHNGCWGSIYLEVIVTNKIVLIQLINFHMYYQDDMADRISHFSLSVQIDFTIIFS